MPQDVQDEWVADWLRDNDRAEEFDPDVVWYPHRIVNRREEALAWAQHEWLAAHEKRPWRNADATSWSKERDERHPHHRDDGTHWVVTQEKPADDNWFAVSSLVAEQAPGDHHEPDDEADARHGAGHPGDGLRA